MTLELSKKLRDEKKAAHEHLSINNGMCSWNRTSEAEKEAGEWLFKNNNASETDFGSLNSQVQTYSMIGLTNAGGIAMARQDGDFNIDIDNFHTKNEHKGKNCTLYFILLLLTLFVKFNATKRLGIIHRLPAPTHNSLLIMARNLRPRQDREDSIRFKAQRDEKTKEKWISVGYEFR